MARGATVAMPISKLDTPVTQFLNYSYVKVFMRASLIASVLLKRTINASEYSDTTGGKS
jgi:hypothetical protein